MASRPPFLEPKARKEEDFDPEPKATPESRSRLGWNMLRFYFHDSQPCKVG